jgi:hypothetical protein
MVNFIRCRKGASFLEVTQSLAHKHRELSLDCPNGGLDLRGVNTALISTRATLRASSTIPDWAKEPLAQLLFKE